MAEIWGLKELPDVTEPAAVVGVVLFTSSRSAACAAAGIVVGVASLTGIGLRMSELIVTVSGGQLPLALLLTAAGSIVLGMGLPTTAAYVVLADPTNRLPTNGVENWMSGYLAPLYQGTPMRATGAPMLHLNPGYSEPESVTAAKRNLLAALDRQHKAERPGRPRACRSGARSRTPRGPLTHLLLTITCDIRRGFEGV